MIDLNRVLTFTEAASKWQLASGNTIRQAALRGKFRPEEVRKSGTVWLTTYEAMERVFGPSPADQSLQLNFSRVHRALKNPEQLDVLETQIKTAFAEGKQLQITEVFLKQERTMYIFATYPEFQHWLQLLGNGLLPTKDA